MSAPQPVSSTVTFMSMAASMPVVMFCGMAAIALWAGVLIKTSSILDDLPSWKHTASQIGKVIGSTMTATMILLVIVLIYFLQDQAKSIYVSFIMIGIAACLSYSAMAAAVAN